VGIVTEQAGVVPRRDAREENAHAVEREISALYQQAKVRIRESAARFHADLQPVGYGVLRHVIDYQPVRAADIASILGIDKSAVSRQVSLLREVQLIETTDDPDDRRAVLLVATPTAVAIREQLRNESTSGYGRVFADWSSDDIGEFARLLHRFNASLD
jgi:DNA-binding MarR family transcriptional regulator